MKRGTDVKEERRHCGRAHEDREVTDVTVDSSPKSARYFRPMHTAPHSSAFVREAVALREAWMARAVLLLVVFAFILFKLPYLGLPYYWDEAWVYAPAVKAMQENGISILPWAIPPELSRGHPLFFHALGALWMSAFGDSFTAMHGLPLCITILLLLASYWLGSWLGGEWLGASAALLIAANEMLLAQSGQLLPETLLALLMTLAVTAYLSRLRWLYVTSCVLALWTKETAIVLVIALVLTHVWSRFDSSGWPERRAWLRWMVLLWLPVAIAGSYFALQWWSFGWVLFPEHVEMITWSREDIAYKARLAFTTAFESEGLQYLTLAGSIAAPLLLVRRGAALSVLSAFGCVAAIKVLWGRWPVPDSLLLPAVLVALAIGIGSFSLLIRRADSRLHVPVFLFGILCIGLWAFSSLNFYTPRYLLPIHPFLVIGVLASLRASGFASRTWTLPAASAIIAAILLFSIGGDGHVGDTRLNYRDAITIHKERIRYCAQQGMQEARIMASFADVHYMTHPEAGYLDGSMTFSRCASEPMPNAEYAFVDYQSRKELPDELKESGFVRLASFRSGQAWGDVYQRR
ncbi:MAG: hypothetical protein IPM12_13555 [Flavobacteriales bacterium]|nr:hypothetical protein [Flavobacteriales bacterium]